jgi:glycosyltransferase involved in cell wall biosynthesis
MNRLLQAFVPAAGQAADTPPRDALVCFSHLRWNPVFQRPQHLMVRAARTYDVVFFEEPVFDAIRSPRLDIRDAAGGIKVAVPVLPVDLPASSRNRALNALLRSLVGGLHGAHRVFWYYTPNALAFTSDLASDTTVYDNIEELAAVRRARPGLLQREHDLFRRCDLVFCGGQSLYEAKRHRHPHVYPFPSGIDRTHFAQARAVTPPPADLAAIARPRLGFFGIIDERLDLDLLDRLSSESPDWHWVMLGPVERLDPATLPRRPNLHWLGARRYQDLPAYLAHFDLGVMPFALNEATRFINPTKTAEFLAAGVPVVSTPIHDVVRPYGELQLVEIASGWEQFLSDARFLLRRPRDAWLEDVDQFLTGMSWDRTWRKMAALLRDVLAHDDGGGLDSLLRRPRAALVDVDSAQGGPTVLAPRATSLTG